MPTGGVTPRRRLGRFKILNGMPVGKAEGNSGADHYNSTNPCERRQAANDGAECHRIKEERNVDSTVSKILLTVESTALS